MVDEVEITNVGGNGVASEVTLKQLKETFDSMAKAKGIETEKTQNGLDKLKNKLKGSSEELGVFGAAAEAAADSLKKFPEKAFDALTDSITGLASELASGSRDLSDFSQHVPGIGGALSKVTGVVDNSFNAFQSLATSGASFGNSLGELRAQAAGAGLTLQEYSQVIGNNTENLAQFGGTVERGARSTARMMDALGDQRAELQALGVTQEELNESLIFYQTITRSGARAENRSRTDQADAAASLTKNMLTLSKLTGEDVKAQQEKIAQAQMDVAFQREMNKLDKDERAKLNAAMLEAQQTGGKVAVDALKAEFLGMPPLTEELQIYTATQQESAGLIRESVRAVRDEAITATDFMAGQEDRLVRLAEASAAAQERNEELLKVGAAGGDGVAAMIAEQSMAGMEFINTFLTEEAGKLVVDVDELRKSIREAGDLEPGEEQQAMGEFRDSLRTTRKTLMTNLVNPLIENNLAPILTDLTGKFKDLAESDGFSNVTESAGQNLGTTALAAGAGYAGVKGAQYGLGRLAMNRATTAAGDPLKDKLARSGQTQSTMAGNDTDTDKDSSRKKSGGGKGSKLGRGALRAGKGLLSKAGPLAAAFALYDLGSGAANAGDILGLDEGEDIGIGDRAAAGIGKALGTFSLGLLDQTKTARFLTGRDQDSAESSQGTEASTSSSEETTSQYSEKDIAAAKQASAISEEQVARLEKLVGFAPQFNTLTHSVGVFEQKFNNLELDYRDIDRSTRSFEKMAEQLEEINNQLDGDQSFFERLNPFNNSENNATAGNTTAQAGLNDSQQIQQLNRTLNDILAVLLTSNDMNKRHLNAARAASGNLFNSF